MKHIEKFNGNNTKKIHADWENPEIIILQNSSCTTSYLPSHKIPKLDE